jgi:signal transduction histidine kinase
VREDISVEDLRDETEKLREAARRMTAHARASRVRSRRLREDAEAVLERVRARTLQTPHNL